LKKKKKKKMTYFVSYHVEKILEAECVPQMKGEQTSSDEKE